MKTNMEQWRKSIMNSVYTPAFPIMSNFGVSLKNLTIKDAVTDGYKQAACIKAVSDAYELCASSTFMDLSVEAQAFGCEVVMTDNETPSVSKGIITDMDSVLRLEIPNPAKERTSINIKAAAISSAEIKKPLFACIIGPFSLAGRLMDMTKILISLFNGADMVHLVLEKCTVFLTAYALAFKKAGANGILMAEPAASLISPKQCAEFSSAYIKKIADAVQDDEFTLILHNCGKTLRHVETMLSTSARGLHFGNAVDLKEIATKIPPDILFMGNLDPVSVFKDGKPDDIAKKTTSLLEAMKGYRNFIVSSGCDIPPGIGRANFDAFFNAVSDYNQQVKQA
jgi:uroporphyrinogen decarboxylase